MMSTSSILRGFSIDPSAYDSNDDDSESNEFISSFRRSSSRNANDGSFRIIVDLFTESVAVAVATVDEVFSRYERRINVDNGAVLPWHEANDAVLINSLTSNLVIDVCFDTFSALRYGIQNMHMMMEFDEDVMAVAADAQRLIEERRAALVGRDLSSYMRYGEQEEDTFQQQTRLATEDDDEDVCCICLVNFPNAAFDGCLKESGGVCCCPCANAVLDRPGATKKCPHCRAVISGFHMVVGVVVDEE